MDSSGGFRTLAFYYMKDHLGSVRATVYNKIICAQDYSCPQRRDLGESVKYKLFHYGKILSSESPLEQFSDI